MDFMHGTFPFDCFANFYSFILIGGVLAANK
jgi:hypothetical protein